MAGATGAAGRVQNDLLFLNELRARSKRLWILHGTNEIFSKVSGLFCFCDLNVTYSSITKTKIEEPPRTLYSITTAVWIVYGVCAGNRMTHTHTHDTLCFVRPIVWRVGGDVGQPKIFPSLSFFFFPFFFFCFFLRMTDAGIRSSEKGP